MRVRARDTAGIDAMTSRPEKRQDHKMEYLGAYTRNNVASLKEQSKRGKIDFYYIELKKWPRRVEPPHQMKGILFGYIQWGKKRSAEQFFVIRAKYGKDDVLVPTPLPMDFDRHTDGKGIFSPPRFGDKSAKSLIQDLARINPEERLKLERIWKAYLGARDAGD